MASSSRLHSLRSPPGSYKFDNFIEEICEKITDTDMNKLKQRFKGIIDANVQTPEELFKSLKENGYIDYNNILYIQQIIRVLNKGDLLETAIRYANLFKEDEVLHVFEKRTRIAAGYDIVEFHVKGRFPSKQMDIENFRMQVSNILLVPLDEVIIKGVQETRSFAVTVMLPKMYVDFLRKQLRNNKQHIIESFSQLQIDKIDFLEDAFELRTVGKREGKAEGSVFIAKKLPVSTQNVQLKGKSNAAQGTKANKSASLKTDEEPAPLKTSRKRTLSDEVKPKTSIEARIRFFRVAKRMIRSPAVLTETLYSKTGVCFLRQLAGIESYRIRRRQTVVRKIYGIEL